MEQKITEPTGEDHTRLAKQVLRVRALVSQHLNWKMLGDEDDLDALQALLDARVLAPADTWDLQCLGIVFGMRLVAAIEGLDWAMVEDEYGRDPALRYRATSLLLYPLTMISKRIEDGEKVDVRLLRRQVADSVERLKSQVG